MHTAHASKQGGDSSLLWLGKTEKANGFLTCFRRNQDNFKLGRTRQQDTWKTRGIGSPWIHAEQRGKWIGDGVALCDRFPGETQHRGLFTSEREPTRDQSNSCTNIQFGDQ